MASPAEREFSHQEERLSRECATGAMVPLPVAAPDEHTYRPVGRVVAGGEGCRSEGSKWSSVPSRSCEVGRTRSPPSRCCRRPAHRSRGERDKAEVCTAVACFSVTAMSYECALPPGQVVSGGAPADAPGGPLGHLRVHRRHLHRRRGAVAPRHRRVDRPRIVWGASVCGVIMRFAWLDAPQWAVALPTSPSGGSPSAPCPSSSRLGVLGFSLMTAGGLLYTIGAIVYARRRPDPWPAISATTRSSMPSSWWPLPFTCR